MKNVKKNLEASSERVNIFVNFVNVVVVGMCTPGSGDNSKGPLFGTRSEHLFIVLNVELACKCDSSLYTNHT